MLLELKDVRTVFKTEKGEVTSVDRVSIRLEKGETIGIVGESGCGKSVTSLSIMRLLGKNGSIREGEIRFMDKDLAKLSEAELRLIRGGDIAMIFQEPMTSLNPVFTIGNQLTEAIRLHTDLRGKAAEGYAIEMLEKVGIPRPEAIMKSYPHSLSGGMRQRVMIAMALSCKPKLLIADEPTTALDVTIQAQILNLMKELREEMDTSIMLITHDLGVVAEMADKVVVMYAGQVVEETDVFTLFEQPLHPYTQGLMRSIPHIETDAEEMLASIPGAVPPLSNMPKGCRFHTRCEFAVGKCLSEAPMLLPVQEGHEVRCWMAQDPVAWKTREEGAI
ncbi:oligopeptide/dipeptide ABC transporter ATP-binding protein [Paenibacillus pabuli]|uniref:Oligopeptide/dipeptide ABC transporter ATP-binding protein n=2 Tax=Paenibacillus TaxID=44249 RepID=A0A855XUE1_9BACL|nr:oligopeptide/dipeptide ABC transporter ATP-binding protein [Paenibacillus pabuli]PXW03194.1 oligopeptide/dipeptide ABC transporter ATP-binding protein [Paenibacillus taichungensis]RAI98098.1 oligopeptide/dipeptide ABC transporter ATP-binding protein [Paenibacillus pabuli]